MSFLVTGASSGIGLAVVSALASRGKSVLAVGRNADQLNALKSQHPALVDTLVADLSMQGGMTELVQRAREHETLDGLVHSAGSRIALEPYSALDDGAMAKHFQLHVSLPIYLNNRLAEKLVGSRILFIDSFSATTLRVGWSAYSIVKAAAQMAAKAATAELPASTVIRAFPGAVRTPLVEQLLQSQQQSPAATVFQSLQARGEMNEPEPVGHFIATLLLDKTATELSEREYWEFEAEAGAGN